MSQETTQQQSEQLTREALAVVLVHHKKQLIKTLSKAGVPLGEDVSDDELIVATLSAIKGSRSFRGDLAKLLSWAYRSHGAGRQNEAHQSEQATAARDASGFAAKRADADKRNERSLGFNDTNGDGVDDVTGLKIPITSVTVKPTTLSSVSTATASATTTPTTTTQKTSWLGSFLTSDKVDTLFTAGVNVLSTKLTANANAASEERALEAERLRLEQMKMAVLAGQQAGAAAPKPSGLSLGAKIAIGVGAAAVVGTAVYFIVKAKKK